MGLTVTNTNTLALLNILNRTSAAQSNTLTQLSTGLKINKASDNPAGLIAMESLGAELTAVNAAIDNNLRADAILTVADGALGEIGSLLNEIESLVVSSASDGTLTATERAANQSQIDSAIASIDRIINTTTFNGKQLLNGSQGIQTTGVDSTKTADLKLYARGSSTSDLTVTTSQTTAAAKAKVTISLNNIADTLSEATEIVIVGTEGTATVSLNSGDNGAAITAKIGNVSGITGVTATVNGNTIDLTTSGTGSDDFVSMEVLSGGTTSGSMDLVNLARATGTDAVVNINGTDVTADGKSVSYSANGYDLAFTFEAADTFTIKASGGMTFQLGPDNSTRLTIGLDSLASYNLGGGDSGGKLAELVSGGGLDLAQQSSSSLKVVRKAISDLASSRGRIGGFQKFQVQSAINSLEAIKTGLTSARSIIADTDYAVATSELNRQAVLMNSGISLLGLANQQTAQILSLLG